MGGIYYLHTNGSLIYKRFDPGDLDESAFVRAYWPVDETNRENAWRIVLEGAALGASDNDIKRLADKWGLDYDDSLHMLSRCKPTGRMKQGMPRFIRLVLEMSPNDYWKQVRALPATEWATTKGGVET